ncbi:MAG: DUF3300 domain-containing protein [Hyphomicrobiales bacterium]
MRVFAILTTIIVLLATQGHSLAQDAAADQQQLLDQGQLDQLVAPIALYPDPLLAQVLVASTYPLEVVQAERWLEQNKDLKGDALTEALDKEDWDNSIKALVGVPDVLTMMNQDLDWTSKLGDAVLAQQADVMDAVQRLRALAQENGKLESNDQQTVTVQDASDSQAPADEQAPAGEQAAPQQVIVIEPTSPETVYVPYYEPSVVYGSWPYPDYPPYYFEPRPGYIFGGAIATGLAWSAGFAIGNAIWGDGFDWHDDNIRVNVDRKVNFSSNVKINNNVNVSNWQHNSYHRRGVNYKDADVRDKFSKTDLADKKDDFRGRLDGDKKPDLGGDKRPSVGDMEAALKDKTGGKKPDVGNLADKKPDLGGNKPDLGGGNKPDLGGKKPDLGGKKPDLGANKPDIKKPDVKKPDLGGGKKPDAGNLAAKKPDIKKPDIKKPDVKKPKVSKPAGNAFDRGDGAKAKDFSKRGHASVGDRSATKMAAKPKVGGGGGKKKVGGGGGGGKRRR